MAIGLGISGTGQNMLPQFWKVTWPSSPDLWIDYSANGNGYLGLHVDGAFIFGDVCGAALAKQNGVWFLSGDFTGEEFVPMGKHLLARYDIAESEFSLSLNGAGLGFINIGTASFVGKAEATPEPGTYATFATGLLGILGAAWRRLA